MRAAAVVPGGLRRADGTRRFVTIRRLWAIGVKYASRVGPVPAAMSRGGKGRWCIAMRRGIDPQRVLFEIAEGAWRQGASMSWWSGGAHARGGQIGGG